MMQVLAIGAMIASLTHPATAHRTAVDDPPPPSASIKVAASSGTGCPRDPDTGAQSVRVSFTSDNSEFFLEYDTNVAVVGPGSTPIEARRNCLVAVAVNPPPGYSYSIAAREYQGTVALAAGAGATYRATAYSPGQTTPAPQPQTVTGPSANQVSFPFTVDQATTVWSPCGKVLNYNVNTEVRVSTSDARRTSTARIGKATGFTVRWQRCEA